MEIFISDGKFYFHHVLISSVSSAQDNCGNPLPRSVRIGKSEPPAGFVNPAGVGEWITDAKPVRQKIPCRARFGLANPNRLPDLSIRQSKYYGRGCKPRPAKEPVRQNFGELIRVVERLANPNCLPDLSIRQEQGKQERGSRSGGSEYESVLFLPCV